MNELYQQVWAQAFANAWTAYQGKPENQAKACKAIADSAATAALKAWDFKKADAAVVAKGQET